MGTYEEGLQPQTQKREDDEGEKSVGPEEPDEPSDETGFKFEIPPYHYSECKRVIKRRYPTISRDDLTKLIDMWIKQSILNMAHVDDLLSTPGTSIRVHLSDDTQRELLFIVLDQKIS